MVKKRADRRRADVILLKDLDPKKEVKGGAGKRLFGESIEPREKARTPAGRKPGKPGGSRT